MSLRTVCSLWSPQCLCRCDTAIRHKALNLVHFPFERYPDMRARAPAPLLAFKHESSRLGVLTLTPGHNPPLLNLSFFTSKTQITALIQPQCLRAYAHVRHLKASPISICSPSFVHSDRALGREEKREKKIRDAPHTCLTQFLQQKLRFADVLYNGMARKRRWLQTLCLSAAFFFLSPRLCHSQIKMQREVKAEG